MVENRRHYRLRQFMDTSWKTEGGSQDISGEGLILNISLSGVLLQTDKPFRPWDNCIVSLSPALEGFPVPLKKGKIMWSRRIATPQERLQCGIKFASDAPEPEFQQWLQEKIEALSQASDANILNNLAF